MRAKNNPMSKIRNQKPGTKICFRLSYFLLFTSYFYFFLCNIKSLHGENFNQPILLAGAAKQKITPIVEKFTDTNKNSTYDIGEPFEDINHNGKWDAVWLAGYQDGRFAAGIHDDLWVRTVVLTTKETTVVLISLDLIGYLFDEADFVKKEISEKFRIPLSHIVIASAHDHSGPDTVGLWGNKGISGKNPEYMNWLRTQIVECTKKAIEDQKSAQLVFGKTRYSNPIQDARPPKVINDLLLWFRAIDKNNKTIATVVNYAMHAEVLNGRNQLITADYPGVLRDELEKKFGGTSLFFAGDIGGMQTPFVFFHSFWSCKRVGRAIANKIIQSIKSEKLVSVNSISVQSNDLLFPIESQRFLKAMEGGLFGETSKFIKNENNKYFLPSQIAVITIGPAQLVTIPGELFPELGNVLREKMSSEYKFLIGLCNNEIGYIVPKEEWENDGYEESMSLGKSTGEILLNSLFKLILPPAR